MTDLKSIIEQSGAEFLGVKGELAYFNDPKTGSTLGIAPENITVQAVTEKMEISRRRFGV